jgi:hypothetical protein
MRWPLAVFAPWLAGCALVSGLSQISIEVDGSTPDATTDTSITDSSTPDTAADASDTSLGDSTLGDSGIGPTVACGMTKCAVPKEECCRTDASNGYAYMCTGLICAGLAIPCDDSRDCINMPNTVCCGHYVNAIINKVECTAAANCTQLQSGVVLCDPNDQNSCPTGTCTLSTMTLPGYYFCK